MKDYNDLKILLSKSSYDKEFIIEEINNFDLKIKS